MHRKERQPQITLVPLNDTITKTRKLDSTSSSSGWGSRDTVESIEKSLTSPLEDQPSVGDISQQTRADKNVKPKPVPNFTSKFSLKPILRPLTVCSESSDGHEEGSRTTHSSASALDKKENTPTRVLTLTSASQGGRETSPVNPRLTYSRDKKDECIKSGSTVTTTVSEFEQETGRNTGTLPRSSYFYGQYTCTNCRNVWDSRIAREKVGRICIKCQTCVFPGANM